MTKLTTVAITLPKTTRAMTGTAIHFTHHGKPAKNSRIALVLVCPPVAPRPFGGLRNRVLLSCLDARTAKGRIAELAPLVLP
ncbi:hypothetical protein GCM10010448_26570 [Streptomyces glomeratus]|uniref:Uncharacterized protein n=1 Tax=Streptomyces glomeratus TaxID=284452 RepID=A0ABP6LFS5_9ACTN